MENEKIKIAFVKFGGLSAGGTEKWLQMMAVNLPKDRFDVDYYYCDSAPYIGSDWKHPDTDKYRLEYMEQHGINLIKFKVAFKDVTTATHDWVNTDFWEIFDENKYDIIQTAKAGPAEYPYFLMKKPVVEFISLNAGVDFSKNIAWSIHLSNWQRKEWFKSGGNLSKSSVIPIPVDLVKSEEDFRSELNIPKEAIVAGMHQRNDDNIFSDVPLKSFSKIKNDNFYFVILGGSDLYARQAEELGLKNIRFIKHSGDTKIVDKFLNTLDIFAHGRFDGETFGTVLAEAMAHGIPCISHRSPIANAQPETIGPGGFFADNEQDYLKYLELLYSDVDLRKKIGNKGAEHAAKYYSLNSCVSRLIDVYDKILGNKLGNKRFNELSYGYSEAGFLQAGDLESTASIAHCVLAGGVSEEQDMAIVKYFLPQVKTFIDVGANIGVYNFLAAKYCSNDAKIYSYEPQKDCCDVLDATTSLNNWESRVLNFNIGLSNKPGILKLNLTATGSSFDGDFNANNNLPQVEVEVDTLDNQVKKLDIKKVDFIKIDVEGFEQQVLEGAIETIRRDKPVLFVEIADKIRGRNYRNKNYAKTITWIRSQGYRLYKSTENWKLLPWDNVTPSDHLAMYLCIHESALFDIAKLNKELSDIKKEKFKNRVKKHKERIIKAIKRPDLVVKKVFKVLDKNELSDESRGINDKLGYVDALRGLAILMVIFVHTAGFNNCPGWYQNLFSSGKNGVFLFFVVSAYTLFMSLDKKYTKEKRPFINFFIRRFFRIAPLYYLGVLYYFWHDYYFQDFIYGIRPTVQIALANIFFIQNLIPYWANAYVPGGWTISGEFIFYSLMPLLFLKIKNANSAIWLFISSLFVRGILVALAKMFLDSSKSFALVEWPYFFFPNLFPVFCLGILLYFLIKESGRSLVKPFTWFVLSLVLLLNFSLSHTLPTHILFAIGFMLLFMAMSKQRFWILDNAFFRYVGKISFSMYLVHFAVATYLSHFSFYSVQNFQFGILRFMAVSFLSAAFSIITFTFVEEPAQEFGKKIIKKLERE